MNKHEKYAIERKSNNQLAEDINEYQKSYDAIPRSMTFSKRSAAKRLQAHVDEYQNRLLKGLEMPPLD